MKYEILTHDANIVKYNVHMIKILKMSGLSSSKTYFCHLILSSQNGHLSISQIGTCE